MAFAIFDAGDPEEIVIPALLDRLFAGVDLSREEAGDAMTAMVDGQWSHAQTGAFLTALRCKGEAAQELAGFVESLRARATPIALDGSLIDTCGTGGDGQSSFNVSTASAFIVAACGVRVAKHGNRKSSSSSGSADVLSALGAQIDLPPRAVERCIEATGIGFLFAPRMHGAFASMAPIRRELGVRTVFNLLGPLCNPAPLTHQMIGVFAPKWVPIIASALVHLGRRRAMVVHGDGFDEVATSGETLACQVIDGKTRDIIITPEDLGVPRASRDALFIASPEEGAIRFREALADCTTLASHAAIANAGVALFTAEIALTLRDGAAMAREAITSGRAIRTLDAFIRATRENHDLLK